MLYLAAANMPKQAKKPTDKRTISANSPASELREVAEHLRAAQEEFDKPGTIGPILAVQNSAISLGKAWCGSWIGFQSRIYYAGLRPTPPGCYFNEGHSPLSTMMNSVGEWVEYAADAVEGEIYKRAKNPDLLPSRRASTKLGRLFETNKELTVSILRGLITTTTDPFFTKLLEDAEAIELPTARMFLLNLRPKEISVSLLNPATSQGVQAPPHLAVMTEMMSLQAPSSVCELLAKVARQAYSHLERTVKKAEDMARVGTNVFIGHGRSPYWRELKDFVQDRLHLPWDEFNRVPVAGTTNIARLSEMLNSAAIALIVMTAEDEQIDGALRARMNVIHEVGLFQGRLGFTRAVVLVEAGCELFSNIDGLGQIRFSPGNISESFEQVRRVFEREGLVK